MEADRSQAKTLVLTGAQALVVEAEASPGIGSGGLHRPFSLHYLARCGATVQSTPKALLVAFC